MTISFLIRCSLPSKEVSNLYIQLLVVSSAYCLVYSSRSLSSSPMALRRLFVYSPAMGSPCIIPVWWDDSGMQPLSPGEGFGALDVK